MAGDSTKFIVDFMLGKLSRNLRLLGFDAEYVRHIDREDLISRLLDEQRILLTRAHNLPKRDDIYVVNSDAHPEQTREVIRVFDLTPKPFTRCVVCNFPLKRVRKPDVEEYVPPYVFETQSEFSRCDRCGRIYWKGTHYERIKKFIDIITCKEVID